MLPEKIDPPVSGGAGELIARFVGLFGSPSYHIQRNSRGRTLFFSSGKDAVLVHPMLICGKVLGEPIPLTRKGSHFLTAL